MHHILFLCFGIWASVASSWFERRGAIHFNEVGQSSQNIYHSTGGMNYRLGLQRVHIESTWSDYQTFRPTIKCMFDHELRGGHYRSLSTPNGISSTIQLYNNRTAPCTVLRWRSAVWLRKLQDQIEIKLPISKDFKHSERVVCSAVTLI